VLILFSSEKVLTLQLCSDIIKSSKRARGGKPGQGRKEMTRTIGWTLKSGKRVEITFTHESVMEDNISYCDGDNLNLGRKPVQSGEITLKVEGMKDVTVRYDSSAKAREFEACYTAKQPELAGYYRLPGFQLALDKEHAELVNAMIDEVVEAGKTEEYKAYIANESAKEDKENREWAAEIIKKGDLQEKLYTAEEIRIKTIKYNNLYNEGGEGYVPTWISKDEYEEAKRILAK
jgi:hypothetical protein